MNLLNKNGIYPIYKPKGVTSYDVIRMLKKQFPQEKIGHGGTLDPLAEGVLVVAIGKKYTATLQTVLKNVDKEYKTVIQLGKTSKTDDEEGEKTTVSISTIPNSEEITRVVHSFIGKSKQIPPCFSAVKIDGVPAYKRARKGEVFELKPKEITIHNINILKYDYPLLWLRVRCASGVYIRALGRDIGEKLQTGGYIKTLIRTAVGSYSHSDCVHIDID